MKTKDYALAYIKLGWSVFPIVPKTKVPYKGFEWKPYQTTLPTGSEINRWWDHHPAASIAIITGGISNLCVLDFEYPRSVEHFRHTVCKPPDTLISKSGSDKAGYHYFFKKPAGYNGRIQKNIRLIDTPGMECDFLADGCYVLAPPSLHTTGNKNQWQNIDPIAHGLDDLQELPEEIFEYVLSKNAQQGCSTPKKTADDLEDIIKNGVSKGRRNDSLARVAGYYLSANGLNFDESKTLKRCLEWNQKNNPPVGVGEVNRTVRSIAKREAESRQQHLTTIADCLRRNEDGDAEIYIKLNRGKFIYDHAAGRWYVWRGHYWQEDIKNEALRAVDAVIDEYKEHLRREN
jgi:hypothetical protein